MSDNTTGPDKELIHSLLEDSRDLITRLEGSTVQRLPAHAGEHRIEIARGQPMVAAAGVDGAPAIAAGVAPAAEAAEADTRHPIRAPLVGTFYRSAQPGAKPFVEEGDVVDQGQTVAIVEAMKLMNHVKTDQAGKVAEILCSDGDWVEFEQPIMFLEPIGE